MEGAFFKCRCFICFKSFEVPLLPDSTYGQWLYTNQKGDFYTYSLKQSEVAETAIQTILDKSPKLQQENDNSKGNTFVKLVGNASNENADPILGYNKCPRCSFKFHSFPKTKTQIKKINHLSLSNSKEEIIGKLKRATTHR